ncbi:MAG: hypothetical protein M3Z01_05065 [Thermoproteota archaeon]|nr:hypothetical protein [Thermoproteota archaeon]
MIYVFHLTILIKNTPTDIRINEINRNRGFMNCLRYCGAVETKIHFFSHIFITGNINKIAPNKINMIIPIVEIIAPLFIR